MNSFYQTLATALFTGAPDMYVGPHGTMWVGQASENEFYLTDGENMHAIVIQGSAFVWTRETSEEFRYEMQKQFGPRLTVIDGSVGPMIMELAYGN